MHIHTHVHIHAHIHTAYAYTQLCKAIGRLGLMNIPGLQFLFSFIFLVSHSDWSKFTFIALCAPSLKNKYVFLIYATASLNGSVKGELFWHVASLPAFILLSYDSLEMTINAQNKLLGFLQFPVALRRWFILNCSSVVCVKNLPF